MEFCPINLEKYLEGQTPPRYFTDNPNLFGASFSDRGLWCAWDIIEQVAKAVEFIHSRGEVHRNLKPRNSRFPYYIQETNF